MAHNFDTLLAQAAELRASGHSWEAVGRHLRRDPRTCQNWPSRFRDRWEPLFRDAQQRRLDQTGTEAQDHFLNLLHADDKRCQLTAVALWLRCAAAVNRNQRPVNPAPAAQPEPGPYARMLADARADMAAARDRLDRRRAEAGLPPVTDGQFLAEYEQALQTLRRFRELSSQMRNLGGTTVAGSTSWVRPAGPARQAGPTTDPNLQWAIALAAGVLLAIALEPSAPPRVPSGPIAQTWLVRAGDSAKQSFDTPIAEVLASAPDRSVQLESAFVAPAQSSGPAERPHRRTAAAPEKSSQSAHSVFSDPVPELNPRVQGLRDSRRTPALRTPRAGADSPPSRARLARTVMPADRNPADRRAAEIIQAWLDGAPPDAAGALARDPELAADKAIALDLAFAEFLIREHKGERLDVEEYCARFPAYHASLGRMLAQQSVGPAPGGLDAVVPGGPSRRGLDTPVVSIEGFLPRPSGKSPSPTPTPTPGGSGSSPTKRGGQVTWPEPGAKVGDFNLLRQLGKGAFGRVFLALEEPTTRHVVVKVSKQKCEEAKVLGRLGHRNVVSVLSAPHDLASGLYLVVMPYHGSATFEDLLELAYPLSKAKADRPRGAEVILAAARRNLQPRDPAPPDLRPDPFLLRAGFVDGVVWLGVGVAEALAAVHASGFVHHDLKPSNVLLGLDGQPRLLDFNLASDARNTKSRLGGTLPYMPPEHLQAVKDPQVSGTMDVRGDVYSLGVILYELLTGTHPFGRFPKSRSARTVAEEMLARQKLGVRPIRERNPDVPHRLARLVEKCLSFDPADRPQTAAAVAAELKQCYSARKRALQFLGTRPGRVAVTAAVVGVVSVASWLVSSQARATPDYRRQGLTALAERRYAEAVPNLAYATQTHPQDPELWLALGRSRLAQGEWRTARSDLERAAELRPGHGPTEATLGWCLAKLGYHDESRAALARAEVTGYTPAGLYVVRGFTHLQVRQDRDAERALARALEIDPGHPAALANRVYLAWIQAVGKWQLPPAWAFAELERAVAGSQDAHLLRFAADFYAWAAHKPAHLKTDWHPQPVAMKERCRDLLRRAVEAGLPEAEWKQDSTFRVLFGDPAVYAKDWVRPGHEADPWGYWRVGDPLVEFAN